MTGNEFLTQSEWLALTAAEKAKVREVFKVGRSGHVKVAQINGHDRIQSDGTEPEDLMASLNVQTALEFLGETYDPKKTYEYPKLWPLVLEKLGFDQAEKPAPEAAAGKEPDPIPPKEKATAKKSGRKVKLEQ